MKAASGELNLTIITLVAISAVIAFFWFMWSRPGGIKDSINTQWEDINDQGSDPTAIGFIVMDDYVISYNK